QRSRLTRVAPLTGSRPTGGILAGFAEPGGWRGAAILRAAVEMEGAEMATKTDFSADEWKTLHKGVTGAGMFVSSSDADLTDSFGEASALAKELVEERTA